MAIRVLEGFDDGNYATRGTNASGTVSSSYGKNGNGIQVGDSNNSYYRIETGVAQGSRYTVGFHVYINSIGGGRSWYANGTYGPWLDYSSGKFHFYCRGSTGGDINWYSDIIDYNVWNYVEIGVKYGSASNGHLSFYLNGVQVGTSDTVDFYQASGTTVTFGGSSTSDVAQGWYDNIYITDDTGSVNTGRLGPIEVQTLLPDGNGNYSQMTGSDSNQTDNYLLVDENPPNDGTDYVESATEGHIDTYTFDDLTGTPTVKGAILAMNATKVDSAAKYLRAKARISSTDYNGSSKGLTQTTYTLHEEVWDQSPASSSAWTYTELNGAEFGAEVRDS